MRRKIILIFVLGSFATSFNNYLVFGQNELQTNNISIKDFEKDLQSNDGEVRLKLAKKLNAEHSLDTFKILLKLLNDKNLDVSYAAAEAIEIRRDKEYDKEFIDAFKHISGENCWPAYRATKNYPTKPMMDFLFGCLKKEIQFYQNKENFDERNCFYISSSLEQIGQTLLKLPEIKVPEGDGLKAYEKFFIEFQKQFSKAIA